MRFEPPSNRVRFAPPHTRDVRTVCDALDGEILEPIVTGDNPRRFKAGDRVFSTAERWAATIVRHAYVPEPVWIIKHRDQRATEWPADGDLVRALPPRRYRKRKK